MLLKLVFICQNFRSTASHALSSIFTKMIKKHSVLIVVLVLVMGSIPKSLLFFESKFREDFTALTFCDKKEIPNNQYHGISHLRRELKAQDERDTKCGNNHVVKFKVSTFYISSIEILLFNVSNDFQFLNNQVRSYSAFILQNFRPPFT